MKVEEGTTKERARLELSMEWDMGTKNIRANAVRQAVREPIAKLEKLGQEDTRRQREEHEDETNERGSNRRGIYRVKERRA